MLTLAVSVTDAIHPAPGAEGRPSYTAVVGSVDEGFSQYPASLRIQEGKQEVSLFARIRL